MDPTFIEFARACYADLDKENLSQRVQAALRALTPEALAAIAEPGGQRPAEN